MVLGRLAAGTSIGPSARAWTGWLEASRELSRELPNAGNEACSINAPPRTAWECKLALRARPWTMAPCLPYPPEYPSIGGCQSSGGPVHSPVTQHCAGKAHLHTGNIFRSESHPVTAQLDGCKAAETYRSSELVDLSALAQEWRQQSDGAAQYRRSYRGRDTNGSIADGPSAAGELQEQSYSRPPGADYYIPLSLIERTCTLLDQRLGTVAFVSPAGRSWSRLAPSKSLAEEPFDDVTTAVSPHHAATVDLADIISSVGGCCMVGDSQRVSLPPDLVRSLLAAATAAAQTAPWPETAKMLQGLVRMGTVGKRFLDRVLARVQRIQVGSESARVTSARMRPGRYRPQLGQAVAVRTTTRSSCLPPELTAASGASVRSTATDMPSVTEAISLLRSLSVLHALPADTASASIGGTMHRLMLYLLSVLPTLPGPGLLLGLLRDVTSSGWRHDREPEFLRRVADYLCTRAPSAAPSAQAGVLGITQARSAMSSPANTRIIIGEQEARGDDEGTLARPPHLHALTPAQVVEVMDIYARAGVHHSGLMERGLDAIDRCLSALTPSQAARVAEACARLSHHRPALMRRLALHVAAHLSLPLSLATPLPAAGGVPVVPWDVASMVTALAKCRVRDERFLDAVTAYAGEHARTLLAEIEARAELRTKAGLEAQQPELDRIPLVSQGEEYEPTAFQGSTSSQRRPVIDLGLPKTAADQGPLAAAKSSAAEGQLVREALVFKALEKETGMHDGGLGGRLGGPLVSPFTGVESCDPPGMSGVRAAYDTDRREQQSAWTSDLEAGLRLWCDTPAGAQNPRPADSLACAAQPASRPLAACTAGHDAGPNHESIGENVFPVQPGSGDPATPITDLPCAADEVALLEALLTPLSAGQKASELMEVSHSLRNDNLMRESSASQQQQQQQPTDMPLPCRQPQSHFGVPLSSIAAGVWPTDALSSCASVGLAVRNAMGSTGAVEAAAKQQPEQRVAVAQQIAKTAQLDSRTAECSGGRDTSQHRVSLDRIALDRTSIFIRRLSPMLQPRVLLDGLLAVPGASIDLYYMPYDYAAVSRGRPGVGCAFVGFTSVEGVAALVHKLRTGSVCGGAESAVLEYLPPSNSNALLRALLNPTSGYGPPRTETASQPMLLYVSGSLRGKMQPLELKDIELYDMHGVSGPRAQLSPCLNVSQQHQYQMQAQQPQVPISATPQAVPLTPMQIQHQNLEPGDYGAHTHRDLDNVATGMDEPPRVNVGCSLRPSLSAVQVEYHDLENGSLGDSDRVGSWWRPPAHLGFRQVHSPLLLDISQLALIAHGTAVLSYHPTKMLETLSQLIRCLLRPVTLNPHLSTAMLPSPAEGPSASEPSFTGTVASSPLASSVSQNQQQRRHHLHCYLPPLKSVLHTLHALAAQPNPDPVAFSEVADVCSIALSAWVPQPHGDEPTEQHLAGIAASCVSGPQGRGCMATEAGAGGRVPGASPLESSGRNSYSAAPAAALPTSDVLDVHVRLLAQALAAAADHGTALYHPRLCDVAAGLLRHRLRRLRMRAACALLQPLVRLRHPPARQLVAAMAPLLVQDSSRLSAASLVDLAWSCARTGLQKSGGDHCQVVRILATRTRQLMHQLPTPGIVQMFWALAALDYNDDACGGHGAGSEVATGGASGGFGAGGPDLYWHLLQALLQRYDITARDLLLLQEGLQRRRQRQQQKWQRCHVGAGASATDLSADSAATTIAGAVGGIGGAAMESFLQELLYRAGAAVAATVAVEPRVAMAKELARSETAAPLASQPVLNNVEGKALASDMRPTSSSSLDVITPPESAPRVTAFSQPNSSDDSCKASIDSQDTGRSMGTGLDHDLRPPSPSIILPQLTALPETKSAKEALVASMAASSNVDAGSPCLAPATYKTSIDSDWTVAAGGQCTEALPTVLDRCQLASSDFPSGLEGTDCKESCDEQISWGLTTCCSCSSPRSASRNHDDVYTLREGNSRNNYRMGCKYMATGALAVGGLLQQVLIARCGMRLEEADGVLIRLEVPDGVVARVRAKATSAAAS